MNWYYALAGQQRGPVDESRLRELLSRGEIAGDTLIWHEGMVQWQMLREAHPEFPPPLAPPTIGPISAPGGGPPSAGKLMCSECRGSFPASDVVPIGGRWVCATCKPICLQKLREGALGLAVAGGMVYAGFWVRVAATLVDALLLYVFNVAIAMLCGQGLLRAMGFNGTDFNAQEGMLPLIQLITGTLYEIILVGKYGATLGKMALKIQVVNADGSKLSYAKSTGRCLASYLSALICCVGYILVAFDDQKRGLHDHLCGTRVVRVQTLA